MGRVFVAIGSTHLNGCEETRTIRTGLVHRTLLSTGVVFSTYRGNRPTGYLSMVAGDIESNPGQQYGDCGNAFRKGIIPVICRGFQGVFMGHVRN